MIKVALIAFSSSYKLKHFFKYPFRYLIQMFSGSRTEHVGICINGYIYESVLHGVSKTLLIQRIKNLEPQIKLFKYEFDNVFTSIQVSNMLYYAESELGEKYNAPLALYSIFDKIISLKFNKNNSQFCSKFVFEVLEQGGVNFGYKHSYEITPKELITLINDMRLTDGRKEI